MAEPTLDGSRAPAGEPTGPRSSLDRVLKAFEARGLPVRPERQNSFMACCPVHDDHDPSLHITWRDGQRGGGVLLYCHTCQARAFEIVPELGLGLADLFDEPLPERDRALGRVGKSPSRRRAGQRRGKMGRLPDRIVVRAPAVVQEPEHAWVEMERYPYLDHHENLVQEVIREECNTEDTRHKQFRQLFVTRTGRRVKRKPEGFYPVLYRTPQVAATARHGGTVWVLEGEKDVHTAEGLGVVATTNTQGGKSFPAELVEELATTDNVVVLDRDPTGWARGVDLHAKLTAAGAAVKLRLPRVLNPKADLTDHVEAGHGLDELIAVDVEEVAAWDSLSAVQDKASKLQGVLAEAQARHDLAVEGTEAKDNLRYAKRWATESQLYVEAMKDLVDQVYGHGMRVGTEWAGEAMHTADQVFADSVTAARRCHLDIDVPLPPALQPPAPEPVTDVDTTPGTTDLAEDRASTPAQEPAPGGMPGGQARKRSRDESWTGEQGVAASAPIFRVADGQIVQWEPDRSRRNKSRDDWDEDEDESGKFKVLLSTVVRVTCLEYLEVEGRHDIEETELMGRASTGRQQVSAPRTLVAIRLQFPDEITGELMEIRVMADQWRDHSWLEALPGHPDYDHKRAGLDQLQRAILAVSENVADEVLYRATGWREAADGSHRFIHRRGAITATGHTDAEVAFSGPIERYDLPDPTRETDVLRQAWLDTSATMLDRLPGRISAPLLGQVFRSVLGHNPWVLTLVGPPGSYKTSVAAKAMQHFGERWEHKKPASSMSGNGDTFNALRFKLHNAKDALYWMDDFAPTKSWLEAQKHLEETARLIHNQEERSRSSRDGLSISDGTGPRASGLCTSEVMPRPGSASERLLVVPLAREDVDTDQLFPLDEPLSRHGRALVMASFISWLAGDLTAKRAHYMTLADTYAQTLVDTAGETVRQAAALAHTWIGWVAVTDFLFDVEAISGQERDQTLIRIDESLLETGRAAVNPDMPRTTGARVRELLSYALRQGIAYVDDVRDGECPPWPLASRLGWRRTTSEVDGNGLPVRSRLERNGIRLGYVLHDPSPRERGRELMCESTQLEAVLKAASATQAERLEIDRNTACRALREEGVLIADTSEGRTRHTIKCELHAEGRTARMVTLHLDKIIDEDDEDGSEPPSGGGGQEEGPAGPGSGPETPGHDGPGAGNAPAESVPTTRDDEVMGVAAAGLGETIPGLGGGDPHLVDATAPAEEDDGFTTTTVGSRSDDDDAGPDQPHDQQHTPSEEHATVSGQFTSRPWTDRAGVVGWTEYVPLGDVAPCVACGNRCGVIVSGVRIHSLCWERTTAADRGTPAAATVSATVATATPGAAPVVRPTPPAPAPTTAATTPATRSKSGESGPHKPAGASPASAGPAAVTGFAAAAAVVDVDGVWLSNGEHMPLPGGGIRTVGDLVVLAKELRLGTQITKYRAAAGQVWLAEELARQMGVDVDAIASAKEDEKDQVSREITKDIPMVTEALEAGYSLGGKDGDSLGRWTRAWQGSEKSIWVVLLAGVTRDAERLPLLGGEPDHATLARRIGLLAGALGHPFHLSGATTGIDLMQAVRWKDRERFFTPREPVPPAQQSNTEIDISWCRQPTPEELKDQWVHAYDRSGSYLAGVSGLELGVGDPVHHAEGCAFAPRTPGYWRLVMPENGSGDWRTPDPLDPSGKHAGRSRWVATPALEFAVEQGFEPEILEAYTWSERARVLDPWYERIRDARTELDDAEDPDALIARDQLKLIYAPTIGMLGSEIWMAGRPGYAPERRHMIVSKARTNILRRVAKIGHDTGRWPVAIVADTVLYTSPELDPAAAWPGGERWMGRELGRYKVEGSAPLSSQVEYLTGGRYKGKDALMDWTGGAE